jgi:2-oxoisovalerate dehydrogenase E1 component
MGAEIAAVIAREAFSFLDAPVERIATFDCPVPYNTTLMDHVVPTVDNIRAGIDKILTY